MCKIKEIKIIQILIEENRETIKQVTRIERKVLCLIKSEMSTNKGITARKNAANNPDPELSGQKIIGNKGYAENI